MTKRRLARGFLCGCLLALVGICLPAGAQTTAPNEWTWVGGSSEVPNSNEGGYVGVYGTMGTPSTSNIPGSRDGATTWTDGNGNLWLFGGGGSDSAGNWGSLNDLWKYDISTHEWAWIGGSSTLPNNSGVGAQPGVYGTLGVPAAGNVPGGRAGALGWTDTRGNLWLFGGAGHDSAGIYGYLNDLWKFNPSTSEWTWIAGSSTLPNNYSVNSAPGVYGTLGVPAPGNTPGGRAADVGWTDRSGNFWLFGAAEYTFEGLLGALNDLWEFNPSTGEWSWISGSNAMSCSTSSGSMQCTPPVGVYGSLGVPAAGNTPGSRGGSASWVDGSGNLWLFGGISDIFDAVSPTDISSSDLWGFNPLTHEWVWMGGSNGANNCITTAGVSTCGQPAVYGSLGIFAAADSPGGRSFASAWTNNTGNVWLFGGQGPNSGGRVVDLNSLWELNPSTNEWAWTGGSSTAEQPGVYGTLGVPDAGNIPGARTGANTWTDRNGNFWLFGGWGYDSAGILGYPNDLWIFQPALSALPTAPAFSPAAGVYTSSQTVKISDITPDASIYFTTDGSTPTTASTLYQGTVNVSSTETLQAVAVSPGYANSAVTSAPYTINLPADATPTFSPAGGTYTSAQTIIIGDAAAGASIYYTTDGSTPTTSSTKYAGAIGVNSTETIKAIATATGYSNSAVASATYTINLPAVATPTFSPAAGIFTSAQSVAISDTTSGATIYYTTDGTTPTTNSPKYTTAIPVATTETIQAIAMASGYTTSGMASATYTIPANFSVAAAPASLTVTAGSNETTTVTITPEGGFSAAVSLTCSGLPSGASCSFSPATVTPSGGVAVTTLTVATPTTTAALSHSGHMLFPEAALTIFMCSFGWKKRSRLQMLLLAVSVVGLSLLTACGGGSSSSGTISQPRPVTSTVTVTATSASVQQATTISLTVN